MASGDTLALFTAMANEPPATNYATIDTRNGHVVLDFDDTTAEAAIFTGLTPQFMSLSAAITVVAHWTATAATSGTLVWGAAIERIGTALDIDADSFATTLTVTVAVAATSGQPVSSSINFTNIQADGVTRGELFRVWIFRDTANAGDTVGGDTELLSVEIREQ